MAREQGFAEATRGRKHHNPVTMDDAVESAPSYSKLVPRHLCNLETIGKAASITSLSSQALYLLLESAFDGCVYVSNHFTIAEYVNLPLQLSLASPNSIFVFSM